MLHYVCQVIIFTSIFTPCGFMSDECIKPTQQHTAGILFCSVMIIAEENPEVLASVKQNKKYEIWDQKTNAFTKIRDR